MSLSLFKFMFALLLWLSAVTVSADSIDVWLDKMNHAMSQQNYQGTLVIRQGDKLQAIKVKQGVTLDGSWQTLESLTGEDQKIIRHNDKVKTIFPRKKLVTISGNIDVRSLHPALPENRRALKKYYMLKLSGQDRVANKVTQIIKMTPRDQHRYGYIFWLDNQSGLLLKCDVLDEKGHVLEQLMYSDVELLSSAPQNTINTLALKSFRQIDLSNEIEVEDNAWKANQMPAGFALTRTVKTQKQNQLPVYHMVFSDGMASVSVFIEKRKQIDQPLVGQSVMGPVNAYSSFVNDAYITAIGEVPASTVRMIAQSIAPAIAPTN